MHGESMWHTSARAGLLLGRGGNRLLHCVTCEVPLSMPDHICTGLCKQQVMVFLSVADRLMCDILKEHSQRTFQSLEILTEQCLQVL